MILHNTGDLLRPRAPVNVHGCSTHNRPRPCHYLINSNGTFSSNFQRSRVMHSSSDAWHLSDLGSVIPARGTGAPGGFILSLIQGTRKLQRLWLWQHTAWQFWQSEIVLTKMLVLIIRASLWGNLSSASPLIPEMEIHHACLSSSCLCSQMISCDQRKDRWNINMEHGGNRCRKSQR